MGLFDFFGKKQVGSTKEQQKWNKLWELYGNGNVESPYLQLMTYQCEINNGGHYQYFTNVENTGNLHDELSFLTTILSKKLADNLQKAYQAYLILEQEDDKNAETIIERCDDVFYENEEKINSIIQEYANRIKL